MRFEDKLSDRMFKSSAVTLLTFPFIPPAAVAGGIALGGSKMIIDKQRQIVYDRQLKNRYGLVPDRGTREYKNLTSKPKYCVLRNIKKNIYEV